MDINLIQQQPEITEKKANKLLKKLNQQSKTLDVFGNVVKKCDGTHRLDKIRLRLFKKLMRKNHY